MLRHLLPYLVLLLIPLAGLELLAVVSPWLLEDLYDHRAVVLPQLSEAGLTRFRDGPGDPVLGWARQGGRRVESRNCRGGPVVYTYDADGARVYGGYDPAAAEIVAVGDSYTAGAEVDDVETFPAQLARLLGRPVANYGVGGYGPVQSLLNLQQKLAGHPRARIAILGIMYENIYRMMNSYRPVLYDKSHPYGLKPYMAGGVIVPHPGRDALRDLAAFRRSAVAAFEHDFWAKPERGFPYTLALIRALGSNYFRFQRIQRLFPALGVPEYFLAFRSPAIAGELRALLNLYGAFARKRGLRPLAVFIPRNRDDIASASRFIAVNRGQIDPDLTLVDVGAAAVAWERFNLQEPDDNDVCHPTPYGYRMIAEQVAAAVRREALLERPPAR